MELFDIQIRETFMLQQRINAITDTILITIILFIGLIITKYAYKKHLKAKTSEEDENADLIFVVGIVILLIGFIVFFMAIPNITTQLFNPQTNNS